MSKNPAAAQTPAGTETPESSTAKSRTAPAPDDARKPDNP